MDPSAQLVLSRRVEAASALRSMVIGTIGMLLGGSLVLSVVFDLGAGVPGRVESGPMEPVALVLGTTVALLSGFGFVRGLVVREESSTGTDAASVLLVTLVTVPLAALAIGGYHHAFPPDKQLRDPDVPYTFSYPGQWEPNGLEHLVAGAPGNLGYIATAGNPGIPSGVAVVAFIPTSPAALIDWVRDPGRSGVHTANQRRLEIAGRPAFGVDYEYRPGKPVQSQFAVMNGRVAFVITCFRDLEPKLAAAGCRKVVETFRFKPGYRPDAAPGRAERAA